MPSEIKNLDDWEFYPYGAIWGRLDSGKTISTSQIVARDPEQSIIQTRSGSLYRLLNHGGKGHSPSIMWNDDGWLVGDKRPIPRIKHSNDATEET